ncbi:HAMP domain-containing histidine kinase [Paenibacillus albidus]|uniref:HAMP domain-containing sensor histidine kinase n=1 Tax=Paenibacillus albidus TaxID=2041023 RepID=UPI001BEB3A82|nr:HAMP domain-containing sensor histidine kinase [Paenibacillus albidus]MBT2293496.1 HAMP domain-containing histidine kinase [Paenibacillus albidus]
MKNRRLKINFPIYASIAFFIIFVITVFITGLLLILAYVLDLFSEQALQNQTILILITLVSCTVIGTIISAIASKWMKNIVNKFIKATNHLASADFSERIYLKNPPEFKILSENFNLMAEELEGINILRNDFINNFSHEFKTPIVSIKGFAEILKYDDLTREERDEYLDIIIEESSRLSTLASNVLHLSKIESQMILTDTQLYNVGEQIRQCVLLLHSKFELKKITLNINVQDVEMTGNKELLSQVWLNLLDNAIKFNPPKGSIDISMQKQGDSLTFCFKDNGYGIDANAISKIFDKFYQQDTSHATAGNGLGLTIVRKIVELHKGTIVCESALMEGTRFIVTLPSSPTESPD